MKLTLNSRQVEVFDVSYGRDSVDSYIISAYYLDTETELTEDELEQLTNENEEWLYEQWNDYWIGEADFYADSYKDGSHD